MIDEVVNKDNDNSFADSEISHEVVKAWIERGKKVKLNEIQSFIDDLRERVPVTYGNCVHLTAIASSTMAHAFANDLGITGFQAGCIQWEWLENWGLSDFSCGGRLIEFKDMCYPQHADRFMSISKSTFKAMQKYCQDQMDKHKRDYEQYELDKAQYEIDIAAFREKYPDYDERPDYYNHLGFGTWDEHEEYHRKQEAGFEFAPKKPYDPSPHPHVFAHWASIIDGNVPFGYKITED